MCLWFGAKRDGLCPISLRADNLDNDPTHLKVPRVSSLQLGSSVISVKSSFSMICPSVALSIVALLTQMGCVCVYTLPHFSHYMLVNISHYSGTTNPDGVCNDAAWTMSSQRAGGEIGCLFRATLGSVPLFPPPCWTFPATGPTLSQFSHHVGHFPPQV